MGDKYGIFYFISNYMEKNIEPYHKIKKKLAPHLYGDLQGINNIQSIWLDYTYVRINIMFIPYFPNLSQKRLKMKRDRNDLFACIYQSVRSLIDGNC